MKKSITVLILLLSAARMASAQPMVRIVDTPKAAKPANSSQHAAPKDKVPLAKLSPMPTRGGAGTLAEVQSLHRDGDVQSITGSPDTSLNGLPEIVRALPEQTARPLPAQVVQPLRGQIVGALPGQVVRALPGQIVPPLPGQLVPLLPGQLVQ